MRSCKLLNGIFSIYAVHSCLWVGENHQANKKSNKKNQLNYELCFLGFQVWETDLKVYSLFINTSANRKSSKVSLPTKPLQSLTPRQQCSCLLNRQNRQAIQKLIKENCQIKQRLALKTFLKTKDQNYDAAMVFTQFQAYFIHIFLFSER